MNKATVKKVTPALKQARRKEGVTVTQLAEANNTSRQAAHTLLQSLTELGEVEPTGTYGRVFHAKRRRS